MTNLRSQLQTASQQHKGSKLEKEVMAVFDRIEDPYSSVATIYKQDNVIKEDLNFVESEEVSLPACLQKKRLLHNNQMFSLQASDLKFTIVIVPSKSFRNDSSAAKLQKWLSV